MSETPNEQSAPPAAEAPHETDEPEITEADVAAAQEEEDAHEAEQEHEADAVEGQDGEQAAEEPPPVQALSEKDMENRWKRIAKSAEVWRKRIPEVFEGDVSMLAPCPLCEPLIPGYVLVTPETPQRFPAVREFMGDAQPQEWEQDPNTHTCVTCNGMGEVKTGSKVQSQATLVCTDCGGKGWQGSRPPVAQTGPTAYTPPAADNGHDEQAAPSIDPPEIAELKRQGYVIIEPPRVTA